MVEMTDVSFNSITIYDLESLGSVGLDELKFGVIGFDRSTLVDAYNTTEAQLAGLDPKRVVGAPLFEAVAPCMNNFLVAQRFEDEPELDTTLPYVLTLRMRPTRVRLRLLATQSTIRRYILIER
jgi:photoactive yellow protein